MAYAFTMDELGFFEGRAASFEIYLAFAERLFQRFPDAGMRVQKTQITFTNPRVFACASLLKVRRAKDRPKDYIVVTFGLGSRVESPRVDAAVEPYPGRWTHHVLVARAEEIDDELMGWVEASYRFARAK